VNPCNNKTALFPLPNVKGFGIDIFIYITPLKTAYLSLSKKKHNNPEIWLEQLA
jgi:hypothetical protein